MRFEDCAWLTEKGKYEPDKEFPVALVVKVPTPTGLKPVQFPGHISLFMEKAHIVWELADAPAIPGYQNAEFVDRDAVAVADAIAHGNEDNVTTAVGLHLCGGEDATVGELPLLPWSDADLTRHLRDEAGPIVSVEAALIFVLKGNPNQPLKGALSFTSSTLLASSL